MSSHYDPNQPRVPAGQRAGGQWSGAGSASESILKSPLLDRHRLIRAALGSGDGGRHDTNATPVLPQSVDASGAGRSWPFDSHLNEVLASNFAGGRSALAGFDSESASAPLAPVQPAADRAFPADVAVYPCGTAFAKCLTSPQGSQAGCTLALRACMNYGVVTIFPGAFVGRRY